MVCKQCGRIIDNNETICPNCCSEQVNYVSELAVTDSLSYESDLGFAKADALYEAPQVMDIVPGTGGSYRSGVERDFNGKPSVVDLNNSTNRHRHSLHGYKKLAAQRQQRLYEELRARLQEEKQESLTKHMYHGLNQDIVEEPANDQNKLHRDKSILFSVLGITAGILLAVVILLYIGSMNERSDYNYITKDAIVVHSSQREGKTYVFNARGDMLYKLEGYLYTYYTPDHTAAIVYNWTTRYCAYVNGYRMKEFETTVFNFALSEDGQYILYSDIGSTNKYYLKLYDVNNNTETMIDNQAKHFDLLNILPDGKTITYITYTLSEQGSIQELQSYMIQNGGKPELIGNDMFIFAVSKDLASIYYGQFIDGTMSAIYVRHNGQDKKLSDGINGAIHMNNDFSEILVEESGGYYLYRQGEERRKVLNQQINRIILPDNVIEYMKTNGITCFGVQSFGEKVLICNDNSIKYLDDDFQSKDIGITMDGGKVTLSKDGETLFYIDTQNRLIEVCDIKGKNSQKVWGYGVKEYKLSEDMSQIYYLRDKNLYYIEKNKEELLISENVHGLYGNFSRDTVFFLKDYTDGKGTLYYSADGLAAIPVEGGTDVTGVKEWNFGVIYQKVINNSDTVFYNTRGKDFVFILDGINLLEENTLTIVQ